MMSSCRYDHRSEINKSAYATATYSVKTSQRSYPDDCTGILYDINRFTKISLPNKLIEISGLTIDNSSEEIFAINDEKAIIFKLNPEVEIVSQIDFGKNGDYEGIEKVDNHIFVLKSNGKIIRYDLTSHLRTDIQDNPLSLTNNTEGLGYDPSTNSLLIACKGSPNIKSNPKLKRSKSVFAFNLQSNQLIEKQFITINEEEIELFITQMSSNNQSKMNLKKKLHRTKSFSLSAIALNPLDSYFYLLSTQGKILRISDCSSVIKAIYFLDYTTYIARRYLF